MNPQWLWLAKDQASQYPSMMGEALHEVPHRFDNWWLLWAGKSVFSGPAILTSYTCSTRQIVQSHTHAFTGCTKHTQRVLTKKEHIKFGVWNDGINRGSAGSENQGGFGQNALYSCLKFLITKRAMHDWK